MGLFLGLLGAFGIGYIIGYVSRELQVALYWKVGELKARRQDALDQSYDEYLEKTKEREKAGLPNPEAITEDLPEKEDQDEEEQRKGIKTFYS